MLLYRICKTSQIEHEESGLYIRNNLKLLEKKSIITVNDLIKDMGEHVDNDIYKVYSTKPFASFSKCPVFPYKHLAKKDMLYMDSYSKSARSELGLSIVIVDSKDIKFDTVNYNGKDVGIKELSSDVMINDENINSLWIDCIKDENLKLMGIRRNIGKNYSKGRAEVVTSASKIKLVGFVNINSFIKLFQAMTVVGRFQEYGGSTRNNEIDIVRIRSLFDNRCGEVKRLNQNPKLLKMMIDDFVGAFVDGIYSCYNLDAINIRNVYITKEIYDKKRSESIKKCCFTNCAKCKRFNSNIN